MKTAVKLLVIYLLFSCVSLQAQSFRTPVEGVIEINADRPAGSSVQLGINSSVLLTLAQDVRFIRGVEIEINAPQTWLQYRGAIVMIAYNNINPQNPSGIADISGVQLSLEPLPTRIQTIYQLPIRQNHGLRTSTTVFVPGAVALPSTFPVLFRFMTVIKGLPDELENMTFTLTARPVFSDEGAVRLIPRYPAQLRDRPFTVMIDDRVITNINEQILLREGEHHLVIYSDDYRNESRRFIVERTKVTDLTIELQDPTPIIIFEGPQNAVVYLNNTRVRNIREPITVQPGVNEIRFQVGDYTVTQTLNVQRGKTYRVSLNVDLIIQESD